MDQKRKFYLTPYLELTGSILIWGASFVATRIALQESIPIMVVWLTFSMGVVVMGLAMALRRQLTLPSLKMMPHWAFTTFWLLFQSGWQSIPSLAKAGWVRLLFLGFFCSAVAYLVWYDGLEAVPVVQVGAFSYFEPLATLLIAALLLGESITQASLLGGLMIISGVWLVNRNRLGKAEGENLRDDRT